MRRFAVIWVAILVLATSVGVLATSLRHEQATQNEGVRTFACFFESAILASPNQSSAERVKAVKFFNELTFKLRVAPCPATPEKGGN